jgi:hypothetical protein
VDHLLGIRNADWMKLAELERELSSTSMPLAPGRK